MPPVTRASTTVMSCDAHVLVVGGEAATAVERLHQLEQRWSRFRSESEVTQLNLAGGAPVRVSPDTIDLVIAMQQGWQATGGCFDPMLLSPLTKLGYDTSRCDATAATLLPAGWRHAEPLEIDVDAATSTITMPAGATIDPGGIGKGLAADRVACELVAAGARGALVEIGGDLRVAGEAPDPDVGWTIGVGHGLIGLTSGGVATSTTQRRTWWANGELHHHLIDPGTLADTHNGVATCTVIAGTGAWAEVFTKVAFTTALDEAIETYEQFGLAASVSTDEGTVYTTCSWNEFLR